MKTTQNHIPQPEIALTSLLTNQSVEEIEAEISEKPTPPRLVYVDKYGIEIPSKKTPLLEYDHL